MDFIHSINWLRFIKAVVVVSLWPGSVSFVVLTVADMLGGGTIGFRGNMKYSLALAAGLFLTICVSMGVMVLFALALS